MDKIKIMYTVNGATKCDILTGTEVSIQRNGDAVHVDFPNADGCFLTRFSKKLSDHPADLTWVSYAHADWLTRSKVETDTSTKPS